MKTLINFFVSIVLVSTLFSCSESVASMDEQDSNNRFTSSLNSKEVSNFSLATAGISNWMSGLENNTSISQISIPGTHDSGSTIEIPANSGTAKNQNLSISEQLNIGVRFLDIRCRHVNNSFSIYHGMISQNINFDDVLNACYTFLESHPTETIIMSVKEEYNPSNNTRTFEKTFDSYVQKNPSKWDLGNNIPSIGEIRGKIRLLRRFPAEALPKGIDVTQWADNTTFEINKDPNTAVKIQDYYKVSNNDTKWSYISALLNEAKSNSSGKLFLNFTSGYKPLLFGIPNIPTVSNNINPKVKSFFQSNTQGTYGIIPMDFVSAELAELVVKTNFSINN
ncbi:phosphatidylinositol-specific phospholipase C [Chryseobacterium sp.]|uniref:phosphatidylinositol-specific phospholipase C n=1 Tax=Chryseobacterium sp. TaxID=1871047 RepID=UPI0025BDAE58|nr:phosphatidylinositol-specific phospholipase C [Chryseobacterium sp.]